MRGAPLPSLAMLFALSACVPDPNTVPTTAAPTQVAAIPAAPPLAPLMPAAEPPAAAPEGGVFVRPDGTAPCAGEPFRQTGRAHFYGRKFHGRRTASGERFDMHGLTAAHNSMPFGTRARVTNLANSETVVVRITDRHADWSSKAIDLSQGAAERLGFRGQGIATVAIEAVCGSAPRERASAAADEPASRPAAAKAAPQKPRPKPSAVRSASARAPAKLVPVKPPVKPAAAGQAAPTSPTTRDRTRSALPGR